MEEQTIQKAVANYALIIFKIFTFLSHEKLLETFHKLYLDIKIIDKKLKKDHALLKCLMHSKMLITNDQGRSNHFGQSRVII